MRGGTAPIGNAIVANGGAENPTANGGEGVGQVDPDGEGNGVNPRSGRRLSCVKLTQNYSSLPRQTGASLTCLVTHAIKMMGLAWMEGLGTVPTWNGSTAIGGS